MPDIYEITIKKISTVTKLAKGEWVIIETRPYTAEELAEANQEFRQSYSEKPDAFALKEVRGYTPEREVTEEVESEIFKQRSENLDLKKVIGAINGLEA